LNKVVSKSSMHFLSQKKGRAWLLVTWVLVVSIASLVGTHLLLEWLANRQWSYAQQVIRDKGLVLDWRELLPPRLAEDVNYAAIDPLWGINFSEASEEQNERVLANRQLLRQAQKGLETAYLSTSSVALGRLPEWSQISTSLVKSKLLEKSPPVGGEAVAIHQALDQKIPILRQIAIASFAYSEAEFMPSWLGQDLSKILHENKIPLSSTLNLVCKGLLLQGIAAVESGDYVLALADARAIILLSKAMMREPSSLGRLVAMVYLRQTNEILWNLCRHRSLSDEQWTDFGRLLSSIDHEHDYLRQHNLEMAGNLELIGHLAEHRSKCAAFFDAPLIESFVRPEMAPLLPDWFFTLNRARVAGFEMEHVFHPFQENGWAGVSAQREMLIKDLHLAEAEWKHMDLVFSRLLMTTIYSSLNQALQYESVWRQGIVAGALERYYLKHQNYPDKLQQLLPDFLNSVPLDPMDHQPVRYTLTDSGRYKLWCVGVDGRDDGGKVNPGNKSNPDGSLNRPTYLGDWVWQYEPVPLATESDSEGK